MSNSAGLADPYLQPQTSAGSRAVRALWSLTELLLFRPSPRPFHRWRRFLLRCFGAEIGPGSHIYPKCRIWAPWNLVCGEVVAIADGAIIYNPRTVTIGSHATVSQEAYICGASHDIDAESFAMTSKPVQIGAYSWVCARAVVLPGVTLGEGSVVALGAIATKDLQPWGVYGGNPARLIRQRRGAHG
jgi:putative colanic acid biosynthesis acetyltransferase WcaF